MVNASRNGGSRETAEGPEEHSVKEEERGQTVEGQI